MTKRKKTNNNLQNITQKTDDRATRRPRQARGEHMFLLHIWHPSWYY